MPRNPAVGPRKAGFRWYIVVLILGAILSGIITGVVYVVLLFAGLLAGMAAENVSLLISICALALWVPLTFVNYSLFFKGRTWK